MNRSDEIFETRPVRRRRKLKWAVLGLIASIALVCLGCWLWTFRSPVQTTEIFRGVTYTCEQLPETSESGGLLHVVEVDLTAPGVDLYVTPMHPGALEKGWQYEMSWPWWQGRAKGLAVAVNANLFQAKDGGFALPGSYARSAETAVSAGVTNHIDPNSYLVWFERNLTPHVERTKPPSQAALDRAYWGVSGQGVLLDNGKINSSASAVTDRLTLLGVDTRRARLWLVAVDKASQRFAGQLMSDLGAEYAIQLDSGDSTCMFLGSAAEGVRSGTVIGGWRPVATTFGVRALPVEPAR